MILVEELTSIEFLRKLGEPYVNQIALLAQLRECPEGTVVFREGQNSPFIYFVLTGKVNLEVQEPEGRSARVYTAGPGGLLGWSPVLGCRAMTATARAAVRSRLAVISVSQILALCEHDPGFGLTFLRQVALVLSERLRHTRRYLARTLSHRLPVAVTAVGSD
jgi:CRP-like cAMP-binding protein